MRRFRHACSRVTLRCDDWSYRLRPKSLLLSAIVFRFGCTVNRVAYPRWYTARLDA